MLVLCNYLAYICRYLAYIHCLTITVQRSADTLHKKIFACVYAHSVALAENST